MADGQRRRRLARRRGASSSSSDLACNTCHLSDGTGPGAIAWRACSERQEQLANGATVAVDEAYIRESILTPQAKLVAGYQPLMPTFQGLVNEEGLMSPRRVREVAARPEHGGVESEVPAGPAKPAAPQENK